MRILPQWLPALSLNLRKSIAPRFLPGQRKLELRLYPTFWNDEFQET
jgi:hypothetical protein